ncbi:putative toxin-antitoxin system toxin component, PIN family [candidate division KSB1 bacterium]|nr:putative toxin-antitoxin system toxin component, PIN family [candidate division KSB1 bacterium]
MIKAVIDTNVFVAGLINETGAPAKIINFWEERSFDLLISEMILNEYKALFLTFTKIPEIKSKEILEIIEQLGIEIDVRENYFACKDISDNKFLDCAINGEANYLVTKNLKHFPKDFRGVKVVRVGDFLDILEKHYYEF